MCHVSKPESEFHRHYEGLQTKCKVCAIASAKASYERNKSKVIARSKEQVRKKKAFIAALKTGPCKDCGRAFPPWAMHFDHLRDKIEDLAFMGSNNRTTQKILAEVAKCDLVCVLCHRDRTIRRTKYAILTPEHEQLSRQWREGSGCVQEK